MFDITQLGLGLATTLVAGERAKTVPGAVTTAPAGAKNSYARDFYDDQTAVAAITQMNAERKVALIPILGGARASIEDYPFTQAITDLAEYWSAGALQGVLRDVGAKDIRATATIEQYRTVSFKPDDQTRRQVRANQGVAVSGGRRVRAGRRGSRCGWRSGRAGCGTPWTTQGGDRDTWARRPAARAIRRQGRAGARPRAGDRRDLSAMRGRQRVGARLCRAEIERVGR